MEMANYPNVYLLFLFSFIFLNVLPTAFPLPMCTDQRAPTILKAPLAFCPYNGSSCCDSSTDLQLQKQFQAMKISDPPCASLMKSILCATCDPFSAELYKVESNSQLTTVPTLCNHTDDSSSGSYSSKETTTTRSSFCSTLWDTCKAVTIVDSPFAPSLRVKAGGGLPVTSNSSTLTQLWQSKESFCAAFGGAHDNTSICFAGKPVSFNATATDSSPPKGLCLEKIGTGSYINMVPHPDGSNRAFFSNLPGKIWMATIPEHGSGESLNIDESNPFIDLTDQVLYDTVFGMMGIAFHPDFAKNGRFFASYNCDRLKTPATCNGRCACNSDVGCNPAEVNVSSSTTQPCQIQTVVAEFSANTSGSDPSSVKNLKPTEARRIFTMGLPFTNDHGGQILFGPADRYLYIMMGDGGGRFDPYNFAQNKKSILGKILRLDVDNIPSKEEIAKQGLWGSYSIPRDNPYSEDKDFVPEIWAMGFRNPWRCSFDAERPNYFVCADIGQDLYEEVDLVTKAGNYGWSTYEGPVLSDTPRTSALKASSNITQTLIFPISGYNHSQVNKEEGSAAIAGGFFYRSDTDPCMYGSYLYGDLYSKNLWTALETPTNSGNFSTTNMPFTCASDSPINCSLVGGSSLPALGFIFSFGEDNRKDVFILSSTGVYRVVQPSLCGYACSKEVITTPSRSPTGSPGSIEASQSTSPFPGWLGLFLTTILLLLGRFC